MFRRTYMCIVYGNLFPPATEICAKLADNFCQKLATVKSGANGMVWLTAISQLTSRGGCGEWSWAITLHNVTQLMYTTWLRWARAGGGGLRSLPFI